MNNCTTTSYSNDFVAQYAFTPIFEVAVSNKAIAGTRRTGLMPISGPNHVDIPVTPANPRGLLVEINFSRSLA